MGSGRHVRTFGIAFRPRPFGVLNRSTPFTSFHDTTVLAACTLAAAPVRSNRRLAQLHALGGVSVFGTRPRDPSGKPTWPVRPCLDHTGLRMCLVLAGRVRGVEPFNTLAHRAAARRLVGLCSKVRVFGMLCSPLWSVGEPRRIRKSVSSRRPRYVLGSLDVRLRALLCGEVGRYRYPGSGHVWRPAS
jgi:hypothetical protein